MFIKQLAVFLENREGRLEDVLQVLKNNEVNIISLSLADTNEFGMLRLLVDKPEEAYNSLKRNGFSSRLTNVLVIKIANKVGMLKEILEAILADGTNVEYMYTLSSGADGAAIVLKTSKLEVSEKSLREKEVKIITAEDIQNIQG